MFFSSLHHLLHPSFNLLNLTCGRAHEDQGYFWLITWCRWRSPGWQWLLVPLLAEISKIPGDFTERLPLLGAGRCVGDASRGLYWQRHTDHSKLLVLTGRMVRRLTAGMRWLRMEDDNLQSQNEAEFWSTVFCFCVFMWKEIKGSFFHFVELNWVWSFP